MDEVDLKLSKAVAVEQLSALDLLIIDLYLEEVSYKTPNLEMVAETRVYIIYHPMIDLIMLVSLLGVRTSLLLT